MKSWLFEKLKETDKPFARQKKDDSNFSNPECKRGHYN